MTPEEEFRRAMDLAVREFLAAGRRRRATPTVPPAAEIPLSDPEPAAEIPPSEAELDYVESLGYDRKTFRRSDGAFDATSTDLLRRTVAARFGQAGPAKVTWGELKRRWSDVADSSPIMLHVGERAGWLVRVEVDEGSRTLDLHDPTSVQGG